MSLEERKPKTRISCFFCSECNKPILKIFGSFEILQNDLTIVLCKECLNNDHESDHKSTIFYEYAKKKKDRRIIDLKKIIDPKLSKTDFNLIIGCLEDELIRKRPLEHYPYKMNGDIFNKDVKILRKRITSVLAKITTNSKEEDK